MKLRLVLLSLAAVSASAFAADVELIQNGGFETGTFSSWTVKTESNAPAQGNWYVGDSSATTPLTGYYAPGPQAGSHYAISDYAYDFVANAYGSRFALSQNFTVAASSTKVVLSFDKWIYDNYGYGVYGGGDLGLGDGSTLANTFHVARIDVLKSSASTFSTSAADVVYTAYNGLDSNVFEVWTNSSVDLTSYLTPGSTYTVRFAVAQYGDPTTFGIDNVSVISTQAVPEPASMLALGGAVAMFVRRRKSA